MNVRNVDELGGNEKILTVGGRIASLYGPTKQIDLRIILELERSRKMLLQSLDLH